MERGESKSAKGKGAPNPLRRALLRFLSLIGIWAFFFAALFLAWCAYDLPGLDRLAELKRRPSVSLLAADGSLLASYGDLYGASVRLAELPDYVPGAILATEDRRFYSHFGIDVFGLARAIYVNLRAGSLVQGGSTITQQLAKNVFLTPERTLHRKGQEMLLAFVLERNFTKDQILELYLNRVYFGAGTYGVDAAARKYFQKPASQVSLYEAAMLAGLLKAPSRFNPFNDVSQAQTRAQLVIRNMVAAGFIGEAQAEAALNQQNAPAQAKAVGQIGQYFADWVIDQVESYVGYGGADLIVETTLDADLQRQAEANLRRIMESDGAAKGASQAALVAMTPDGAVKALVGGLDYRTSQFNRATQALRQPGSAFKAFVYLAGFEQGLSPDSQFVDGPIAIGKWRPANYEDRYLGEVSLREAFAKSLNSVAVQVSERIGRNHVIGAAKRLGITENLDQTPAVALGVSETTLLEMTGAYATFANLGEGVWPRGIDRIRTSDGLILYERHGDGPGQVVAAGPVNAMLDIMAAVTDWGTGRRAKLDRPTYGKTGTSQEFRDAWFIGLTANLVTGVWVGNDDGKPMDKVTGGTLPVAIWRDFMAEALASQPAEDVRRPVGQVLAGLPSGGEVAGGLAAGEESFTDWLQREIFSGGAKGATEPRPTEKAAKETGAVMPPRGNHKD